MPIDIDPLAQFRRQMQALRQPLAHAQTSIADQLPEITPQEQESLLAELAGSVGSGLSYAAETLDKPGRALRGLLAGEPSELLNLIPFSDTMGITDPQKSINGRELLTRWGLTEPNNPDEWEVADFLGFGAEVLLDPLLPLGLGKRALTESGKVAQAAGLLDDAAKIAGAGPRVSRMTTTLDDLVKQSPEAMQAVERAAQESGALSQFKPKVTVTGPAGKGVTSVTAGSIDEAIPVFGGAIPTGAIVENISPLDQLLATGEPLGGVASYFGQPFYGPTAQKIGGLLDTAGEAVRMSKPVRYLASAFDSTLHGALTPEVQKAASEFSEATGLGKSRMDEFLAEQMTNRLDANLITPEAGRAFRMALESPDPADIAALKAINPAIPDKLLSDPKVQQFAADARRMLDSLIPEAEEWGANIPLLKDDRIKYGPRYISAEKKGAAKRTSRAFSAEDPSRTGRIRPLTNIGAGTETIETIIKDPALDRLIQVGAKPKDIANWLDQKYGALVPLQMTTKSGKVVDQRRALARYLSGLSKETRQKGLFTNDPFFDLRRRLHNAVESVEAAKTVFGVVSQPAFQDSTGVALTDVLKKLRIVQGTDQKGFVKKVADALKIDFKAAKKIKINPETADDLLRFYKSFSGPDSVNWFVKTFVDAPLNLFKMGVLSWPSRHVRDFVSGMFNNYLGGELSVGSVNDAWKLLRGEVVEGADQIPIIKETMKIRGMKGGAQDATKVLRELVFSQNLINKYGNIAGDITGATHPVKGTFEDLVAAMPGAHKIDLGDIAQQAVPRSKEQWNPLNVRGVGDREESKFFVAKTSEEVGYLSDSMNRLVPFLNQLKRGVEPRAAKLKTMAMQVDYTPGAYTPLERQVVARMVPFYRFTKGMTPWVLRQLWEQPGGKLAQTLRATNAGRAQGFVPDYVGTGIAIPLGETEAGTQRYLSQLGLAHEAVFDLFRPGRGTFDTTKETLSGLMGNLNPMLKIPIEVGTGRQLFTGRDMEELDSRLGRILNPQQPVSVPLLLEEAVMNSPLSKAVTTAGLLRDPRKSWGDVALNSLTGARVSDVDMGKAQYFASREALDKLLSSNPAVRKFSQLYVKPEELSQLAPEQQRAYALYRNVQAESAQQARERKRLAQATATP